MTEQKTADPNATNRLIGKVRGLLYAQTLLGRIAWAIFAGLLVGIVVLLVGRMTGWMSFEHTRWALAIGPAVSTILVLLATRRPDSRRAASEVDEAVNSGDLFLTSVTSEDVQEFSPLVREQAAKRAERIDATNVVGLWDRVRPSWVALAIVGALAADFFTPILDPFGVVEQAEAVEKTKAALEHDVEQAVIRKVELKKRKGESKGDLSPEVDQALDELLADMPEMVRQPKSKQGESIRKNQRELGQMWEKVSNQLAEQMLSKEASGQRFGGEQAEKFNEWKKELQEGRADSLKSEFDEIKDLLKQAQSSEPGSPKASEAMRMAEKKLTELKKFAEQELGSPELAAAVERAMRQMDAAQTPELQAEAMQALAESAELGELESEALAQAARDMEALQEALETMQMMRQMQGRPEGEFDPTEMEGMQSISDYAEFYRQLLAEGNGQGTGGEGQGDSESVDEDDSVSTGFRKEVAQSYLQKGQMLMSLKGKGEGIQNEDEDSEFQAVAESLEQDALEAVEVEGIPPGYRDGIKSYFRSIGKDGVDED